jgi:hypothetical protein
LARTSYQKKAGVLLIALEAEKKTTRDFTCYFSLLVALQIIFKSMRRNVKPKAGQVLER